MTDTRPRFAYLLPDGTEVRIIFDHGDVPPLETTYSLADGTIVRAILHPQLQVGRRP